MITRITKFKMGKIENKAFINFPIILVSVLLIAYTGIRAATLSFTIDESLSFNLFVPLTFMDIVSYKIAVANNHMINSLLIKYISMFFGTSEFLLRLPSLISHVLYLVFTYKLLHKVSSSLILLSGFLLLNLNPYLLDLFSLARGYGMAVSFTVVSVYFFIIYLENLSGKMIIWSLIFSSLAVLCNFSLLIFYISLIIVINIHIMGTGSISRVRDFFKMNIPAICSSVLLIVIMFEPIRKLLKYKEFYDGGSTGFWQDTVGSLITATLYDANYQSLAASFLQYFIAISLIIMVIALIYRYHKKKKLVFSEKFTLTLLLLLMTVFVSIIQHLILGSNFLINRMALFLIPLFFIPLIVLINDNILPIFRVLSISFCLIVTGAFSFHTVFSFNLTHSLYWKFDADIKSMMKDLEQQTKTDGAAKIKLGAMWLNEPSINFYRQTKNFYWMEKVADTGYSVSKYDYYYLPDTCGNFGSKQDLTKLKHYTLSSTFLARK
jgi:hypothetical protein